MSAIVSEPRVMGRPWTADEVATMRADYRAAGVAEMARRLTRTESAIRQRAVKMGLARYRPTTLRGIEDARTAAGQLRRARILLAYHMNLLSAPEAADALRIPIRRLHVECAKDASVGQAEAGPGPAFGRWAERGED